MKVIVEFRVRSCNPTLSLGTVQLTARPLRIACLRGSNIILTHFRMVPAFRRLSHHTSTRARSAGILLPARNTATFSRR